MPIAGADTTPKTNDSIVEIEPTGLGDDSTKDLIIHEEAAPSKPEGGNSARDEIEQQVAGPSKPEGGEDENGFAEI